MDIKELIRDIALESRAAARELARAGTGKKNAVLEQIAVSLEKNKNRIQQENRKDLEAGKANGLSAAMLDRLELTDKRMQSMIGGVREVVALPDPVGHEYDERTRPNGLVIKKVRVPIGVIGIIYESRPNVTVDAAALTLKAGNAVILRGGSESINSNLALAEAMGEGIRAGGMHDAVVQVIPTIDRQAVGEMLILDGLIDLIIPRGGKTLIRRVVEESRIPVIKHYDGVCHLYVEPTADLKMAESIALNAKVQRPGVCNALETLLIDKAVAAELIPGLFPKLRDAGVEIRGCEKTREYDSSVTPASGEDWAAEYLDLILAVRVVADMDEAIEHIETYGSHHTDAIVTADLANAGEFVLRVDSSSVMVNASTRFSDGQQYGLGAEIGISTDKLHARGPMGLEELTTYKWVVVGQGQVRE